MREPALRPSARVRRAAMCASVAIAVSLGACSAPTGHAVRVTIPAGASFGAAADSLAHAGVIGSSRLLRLYAVLRRADRSVKPGTYMLPRGSGYGAALEALRAGRGIVHIVTIPEGFAISQIAPVLVSRLNVPMDSVLVAVRDSALLHRLDVPSGTLEGYLFPDTYIFGDGTTARAAIETMVRRFEQVWEPAWTARLDTIALSRNDVLALAAIVEKEAKRSEERPVIAAVYMNRLRDGMLLQADPTVQYALPAHQSRVLYRDLAVESPYNTYKHRGLPPGPIASPGRASILAALYPASVPYKFFVALPDGHHEFRTDFASHEAAVRAARRARDSVAAVPRGAAPSKPGAHTSTPRTRKRRRN